MQTLYPDRDKLIDRGLGEYPAFLELCEDYQRCFATLENLRRSGASGHLERICEYEELLAELGREVEGWLEGFIRSQA